MGAASGVQVAVPHQPLFTFGDVGIEKVPDKPNELARLRAAADAQIVPANAEAAPAGTPLRVGGPIKHVFYIVRENRTFDQVLGEDPRGDGNRSLKLFGQQRTPNVHALVSRFPLLDRVHANSEASIQGHFWTSAASISDYTEKNWCQNYAGRGRPADFFIYAVSFPQRAFLFDQADRDGVSWFNYAEAAGNVPLFPEKDPRCGRRRRRAPSLLAVRRANCFRAKFAAQLASAIVPAFNYSS